MRLAPAAPAVGVWIASLLYGAWRPAPPPLAGPPAPLREIAPFLLATGAGALAWHRLRGSSPADSGIDDEVGDTLHQAYRRHVLEAALHERDLVRVIGRLRAAGVEPLLVKGWSVARLYPEPGLRPYGDLDVCVRGAEHRAAARALAGLRLDGGTLDLHRGCHDLGECAFDDLLARSRLLPLEGVDVRVLGPEDELRLLCRHLLRHGVWRPLWLVDVAAALESLDARFDWGRFLAGSPRAAAWLTAVLALAGELLGARLDHTPAAAASAPRWLAAAVLRQWSNAARWPTRALLVPALLGRPAAALAELRRRWPDPIRATVGWRGPEPGAPRWPFQLLYALATVPSLGRQATRHALAPVIRRVIPRTR